MVISFIGRFVNLTNSRLVEEGSAVTTVWSLMRTETGERRIGQVRNRGFDLFDCSSFATNSFYQAVTFTQSVEWLVR